MITPIQESPVYRGLAYDRAPIRGSVPGRPDNSEASGNAIDNAKSNKNQIDIKDQINKKSQTPEKNNNETQRSNNDFNKLSEKLTEMLEEDHKSIEFTIDDETNKLIMKVIDTDTDEVIQQYPPEIALKIARFVASTLENSNLTNERI